MSSAVRCRPNLFLVGSMKCGTTSLHNYLAQHPQIFMSRDPWKEPAYFVDRMNWSKGESWYCGLFRDAADAAYRGESSTDYTKYPHYEGVAERIARFCPEARILYLMRDPVERSISHYWWEVQWSAEGRDMPTAVRNAAIICDVSHYAMQLRQFIPLFGRERIWVLTTEELSARPEAALADIFGWLGVDASTVTAASYERHNVSPPHVRKVIGSEVFSPLRGGLLWHAAKRVTPLPVRRQAMRVLSRKVPRDDTGIAATIDYLRPIQREQTAELGELLGRSFPEWKTLYGTENPE
jgi:Sulfotransferase family